jgi:hypothetical protein
MWPFVRSPRLAALVLLVAVCGLIGLSMYRSYALGQFRTMYDNPIYRWRVSIAVALSQLHNPPLHGFVAYRSISDYLNHHGLALMEGEAVPLPSYASVRRLAYDPDRLEALFRKAIATPINYTLPPVPISGSEKGEAAFYYWAFRLFGIHLSSLWFFYFTLLVASSLLFFIAFWRSPLCILLLLIYLIGHLYMVDFASQRFIQTLHNSRFYPALALLPSLHLLLLVQRRQRPNLSAMGLAGGQVFLLFFLIFGRVQAAWQPSAIVAIAILNLPYRRFWPRSWRPRALATAGRHLAIAGWPAIMVIAGGVSLYLYQDIAFDRKAYSTETKTHAFWDPLVVGTISASPALSALYGLEQEPYSDTMGYIIARHYLRAHHITNLPIVDISNGEIQIVAMRNMGVYDMIMRKVFYQMMREHPFLVLQSFGYYKLYDEYWFVTHSTLVKIYFPRRLPVSIILTIGCCFIVWLGGTARLQWDDFLRGAMTIPLVAICSLSTIVIMPSVDIPDTIFVFVMLMLMLPAYGLLGAAGFLTDRTTALLVPGASPGLPPAEQPSARPNSHRVSGRR